MDFFIAAAHAQQGGQDGNPMSLVFMLAAFGLIFYFMIFRPQNKRMKEHKNLISSLSKGTEIILQGGIVGKIEKVSDDSDMLVLQLTEDVSITVQKNAVVAVLPKGSIKTL